MTCLINSLMVTRPQDAESSFANGDTDLVELRIDRWAGGREELRHWLPTLPPEQWILTCRHPGEGGQYSGDESDRYALLSAGVELQAGIVDIEWKCLPSFQEFMDTRNIEKSARIIASAHDFSGRPANLHSLLNEMTAHEWVDIPKLAWRGEQPECNFLAFDLMTHSKESAIAIVMGELGLPSRILAAKFGAFATYVAADAAQPTAPGQPSLSTMKNLYGWDRINKSTELYGVIGDPVRHSLSPNLFNHIFSRYELNALYVPWLIPNDLHTLNSFLQAVDRCADAGSFKGFSVTIPHKESVFSLAASDSPLTTRVKAANTLRRKEDGWQCINTDVTGVMGALKRNHKLQPPCRTMILGAGGAARAAVTGLVESGCDVIIVNRTQERAETLAAEFSCRFIPWEERSKAEYDLLINTTNVGMWPHIDESPMPASGIRSGATVLDMVYRPLETRLLREAQHAGAKMISGLDMFVIQAMEQLKYWRILDSAEFGFDDLESFLLKQLKSIEDQHADVP
jgi:3-dehydroquinate dehydratase/shikimate dehydrogenase